MELPVYNMAGEQVSTRELPASIFEASVNRALMHQALIRQLANARQGNHKAKTRSEVNRSTAKIYRQKGTGRARHGSRKAPIFVSLLFLDVLLGFSFAYLMRRVAAWWASE